MSNAYYAQQPSRRAAYDDPLAAPYASQSRPNFTHMHDSMDGADYHHFHGAESHAPQPYHDPYATLTPGDDRLRADWDDSRYSKDLHSDDAHDATLRPTHYTLAKDDDTGRLGYGRGHRIEATDGLLPDTPPDPSRLNAEQREIMKRFPADLDAPGGGKSGIQAAIDLLKDWKSWFQLRYLHWWIMLVVVIAIVALTTIYHRQIVDWLTPISKKVTTVAWGWIIPVAILFIISFPPLFGHEIVLILVGLVYGIWIGFGIASLGTLLGEIGNFYAFKHCLRSMAASYERKNIHYACMAEMVRDGGFWVMFLARLSAIPGHFTTAVFATVGMNIFVFTLAAILALPKQLLIVYLGVAIKNSGDGTEDTKSKIIKYVVLAISFVITVWTAYWLYQKMEKVRPAVSARLRQKRYELLLQARTPGTEGYSGEHHSYPPRMGGAYRQPFGVDEMYNGHPADVSSESYDPPPPTHIAQGRQPILRDPRSQTPQQHPPQAVPVQASQAAETRQFHRPMRVRSPHDEAAPLTSSTGEWASSSSLASPVDAPPPDYTTHLAAAHIVDPTVQRYHLHD